MISRLCFLVVAAVAAFATFLAPSAFACEDDHIEAKAPNPTSERRYPLPKKTQVSEAIKGVRPVGNVPEAKDAISMVFLEYGKGKARRSVLYVTGRFGLKAYDITADPTKPRLVGQLDLPGMWETEDTEADPRRKLIFLARDPRAFGGNTGTGESGIYIVDASTPEKLATLAYTKVPAGHTTSCIERCRYLWTGGPAKANTMPADWGGRPVWVTDIRDPRNPKTYPDPIELARNDGKTDYVHDVQVDARGVAWASGRGGVRGYWTSGWRWDPVERRMRLARPWNPVPYAGGGINEASTHSTFMHNSFRPVGHTSGQAPGRGKLVYVTEETFQPTCEGDGLLVISSLAGSYNGEGWRSTPDKPFRLRTVGTWHVHGQEGSRPDSVDCSAHYFDVRRNILVQSFYEQGTRFLDVSDPAKPKQVAYHRADATRSWQPYWHGKYVYVADHLRGIDILEPTF